MSNQKPKSWWEQRRGRYNLGVILSGVLAYIFIFIIEGHKNFSLLALIVQGIGSWIYIGFANLFYFLGPLADKLLNKEDKSAFRERLYNLVFGFSILLPILFAAMFLIFPAWDYGYEQLKNKPSDIELYGVYELNSSSKKFLIHKGYNIDGSRLELNSGNTFYFHKLPDNIVNDFGNSNGKTIDQTGKWNVYCPTGDNCQVEIEHVTFADIVKKNDHFSILITIGDPDSREGIVYEKTSNQ
ncbi:hypothetical protein [Pedobacter sp. MW01-1-1]|uniref:hypothetical protein n=1 Tax=Pedobacter sp. MW01-1-1 TaxID=3383027 RepID=UPI003FF11BCD